MPDESLSIRCIICMTASSDATISSEVSALASSSFVICGRGARALVRGGGGGGAWWWCATHRAVAVDIKLAERRLHLYSLGVGERPLRRRWLLVGSHVAGRRAAAHRAEVSAEEAASASCKKNAKS